MALLTFEDFPKDISEALKRAHACQKYYTGSNTLYFTSRDSEESLTDAEKTRIREYLIDHKHLYKRVVFETYIPTKILDYRDIYRTMQYSGD